MPQFILNRRRINKIRRTVINTNTKLSSFVNCNSITKIMTQRKVVSLSIQPQLLETLDKVRGDVSRSKYLQRLVEKNLVIKK